MDNNRSSERQHLKEDCDYCEKVAREDERIKVSQEIYGHLEDIFDRKLGNFQSNSKRLDSHDKWLVALTVATIGLYLITTYLIVK